MLNPEENNLLHVSRQRIDRLDEHPHPAKDEDARAARVLSGAFHHHEDALGYAPYKA
jgi:hypothetical protein